MTNAYLKRRQHMAGAALLLWFPVFEAVLQSEALDAAVGGALTLSFSKPCIS